MPESLFQPTFQQTASAACLARIKPLILVAEDSFDGREMMCTLLRLKGYDVVLAENGVRAIDVAVQESPDLIFVDLELPRLDGISVARNVRRISKLRHVPIVVISGHDPASHREPALAAGCTDYLAKPIDFERLDAVLELNVPIMSRRSAAA